MALTSPQDDIAIANLGGLTYVPVANANGAVTFTFKVYDGEASSGQRGHIHPDPPLWTMHPSAKLETPSPWQKAQSTLDGTGSSDVESDTITYAWTVASGTAQTVSNANTAALSFTASNQIAGYTTTPSVGSAANGQSEQLDTVVITVSADNDGLTALPEPIKP